MANRLYIISGPSGVGKDTIIKEFLKTNKNFVMNVTYTTREPRPKEINGISYYFITRDEFINKIEHGDFVEYDEHFGNLYGTSKSVLEAALENNNAIAVLDVNGALNIKQIFPDAVLIMVVPPSVEELKKRLDLRRSENGDEIKIRMARIEYELSKQKLYDYVIINETIESSVKELERITRL